MRFAFASGVLLAVTGCATITTGQNQPISVETPGCQAATCKLSNDKGTWYVSATPGSATVQRAYGDMTVTCEKADYRSNPHVFKSSTKAMAFGNIIFGGIIGAAVDAGSGAAYDYPTLITVSMICAGDPKTVVQPSAPSPEATQVAAPSPTTAPTAQPVAAAAPAPATTDKPVSPSTIQPVSVSSAPLSVESKYMFAAERYSKSLGCQTPVATINIRTATGETFTIRCEGRDPLSIRCENGECRELK